MSKNDPTQIIRKDACFYSLDSPYCKCTNLVDLQWTEGKINGCQTFDTLEKNINFPEKMNRYKKLRWLCFYTVFNRLALTMKAKLFYQLSKMKKCYVQKMPIFEIFYGPDLLFLSKNDPTQIIRKDACFYSLDSPLCKCTDLVDLQWSEDKINGCQTFDTLEKNMDFPE